MRRVRGAWPPAAGPVVSQARPRVGARRRLHRAPSEHCADAHCQVPTAAAAPDATATAPTALRATAPVPAVPATE